MTSGKNGVHSKCKNNSGTEFSIILFVPRLLLVKVINASGHNRETPKSLYLHARKYATLLSREFISIW